MRENKKNQEKMKLLDDPEEVESGMYLSLLADEPGEAEAAMHLNSLVDNPKSLNEDVQELLKAAEKKSDD